MAVMASIDVHRWDFDATSVDSRVIATNSVVRIQMDVSQGSV